MTVCVANFGVQLKEMQHFIQSLPPNAGAGRLYAERHGAHESGFTTNHEAAAQQVRIPLSVAGLSASPYFCLSDFVKHWPGQGNAARRC